MKLNKKLMITFTLLGIGALSSVSLVSLVGCSNKQNIQEPINSGGRKCNNVIDYKDDSGNYRVGNYKNFDYILFKEKDTGQICASLVDYYDGNQNQLPENFVSWPSKIMHNGNEYLVKGFGYTYFGEEYIKIFNHEKQNWKNLTSVDSTKLPQIRYIFSNAFEYTEYLTNFTFNENIIFIGDSAFTRSNLQSVDLSMCKYIKEISSSAFSSSLSQIESILLPPNLIVIDDFAFKGAKITELVLPLSIEIIGNDAFLACESLTTIRTKSLENYTFSSNLKSIGRVAFKNTLLKTIKFQGDTEYYSSNSHYPSFPQDTVIDGGKAIDN